MPRCCHVTFDYSKLSLRHNGDFVGTWCTYDPKHKSCGQDYEKCEHYPASHTFLSLKMRFETCSMDDVNVSGRQ